MSKPLATPGHPLHLQLEYAPHAMQQKFHASKARFRVVVAGMRAGKTKMGAAEIVRLSWEKPGWRWVVAPTYPMLQNVSWREIQLVLEPVWDKVVFREYKRDRIIEFRNGAVIQGKSTEWPDTLRGPGLLDIWADEASFIKREAAHIMRTRVSDTLGGIFLTTTPRGKNWVWEWYQRGLKDSDLYTHGYESFHFTSLDNPFFPPSEWEEAKATLPHVFFRQEFEAMFLDNELGAFSNVEECIRRGEEHIIADGPFVIGVDWARKKDYSALCVMDAEGVAVEVERVGQLTWRQQIARIKRAQEQWNAHVIHDSTGLGDPLDEKLREELGSSNVTGVIMEVRKKMHIMQELQAALENGDISLPNNPVMKDELKWYETELLPSGLIRFKPPSGYHADYVVAVALANWGRIKHLNRRPPVIVDLGGRKNKDGQLRDPFENRRIGLFAGRRITGNHRHSIIGRVY